MNVPVRSGAFDERLDSSLFFAGLGKLRQQIARNRVERSVAAHVDRLAPRVGEMGWHPILIDIEGSPERQPQAPMARVVIGGLTTSTMITLLIIPIIYMTLEERVAERGRRFGNQIQSPDREGGVSALTRSSDGGQRCPLLPVLVEAGARQAYW